MIYVSKLTTAELRKLNEAIAEALPKKRSGELAALRARCAAMVADHGLTMADIAGGKSKRSHALQRMKDTKSGVIWAGAGRYPQGFVKSRAVPI